MSEGKDPGGLPGYCLHAFTAEASCSILGQRTKTPWAIWCGKKKRYEESEGVEVLEGFKSHLYLDIRENEVAVEWKVLENELRERRHVV